MGYPKHEGPNKRQPKKPQPDQPIRVEVTGPNSPAHMPTPSMQHDINHVAGMAGIEESLDWLAKGINKLTSDDHTVGVIVGQNLYGAPVKLALSDSDGFDMMDRLVEAFERIADSVAKLAGLNRPRLESWHEQDAYEPRFKDVACDGGAPGPKTESLVTKE
jgi:hypothetical protein